MAGSEEIDPHAGAVRPWPDPTHDSRLLAPELACLAGVLAPSLLNAARERAAALNIGAEQVLLSWGVIDEDAYLARLAASLGLETEPLASFDADDILEPDAQILTAARVRMLTLRDDAGPIGMLAPRHFTAGNLVRAFARHPGARPRIRLATRRTFDAFVAQHAGDLIANEAVNGLARRHPHLSTAPRTTDDSRVARWLRIAGLGITLTLSVLLMPTVAIETAAIFSALWFLAFAALRLFASLMPRSAAEPLPRLRDDELPVYSIIVALYREAASVEPLLQAIAALDYPPEKLNVILAVEPDDLATRAAIARAKTKLDLQVVIAANSGPRTKPKALNCALPYAAGSFIVVYDAEDRPEPGQLRAALDAFRSHARDVACAQASLCVDNVTDSLWSRMFAAEYAGQFDVFLPGAASLKMPLPLGGSSNHFRTDVLQRVGAWDPWNVTEDADLGLRLARLGYRSVTFESTTFEEAPVGFRAWLHQRSRWMKGWMQTWAVHMRSPRRLWRETGARGFLTINLVIGGNVLTALAHLLLIGEIAYATGAVALERDPLFITGVVLPLHVTSFCFAWFSTFFIGAIGLAHRGLGTNTWILLLAPLYWIALSIAAWRALFQLVRDPYRWEKTEHGLARRRHFTRPDQTVVTSGEAPAWLRRADAKR